MFSFKGAAKVFFQTVCIILYSLQQCVNGLQFLCILTSIWFCHYILFYLF